ncbi:fimbrial protein [Achromobacter ruhlandii]|uniref:fimbrial protein n=1 Tax=Achromobacter ruhlandii TaxID=72557 RepID=UPI0028AC1A0E|nr:fimbrial protein [Achromobacter ruhlandii]MEB6661884.1 fimbrial protein [Achromobacter ruhlandii]
MVAPASWRRRLLHTALTAGLASPLIPASGAPAAPSSPPPTPAYVARGIGVLSPVQPVPVRPAPSMASRAVPLDPSPCDLQTSEPAMDTSVAGGNADADVIPGTGSTLSGDAAASPLGCEPPQAAAAQADTPDYSFDLESGDVPRVPVVVISGVSRPSRPWFASVSGQDGLRYGGDRNWVYRNTTGPSFSVGNINANAPTWGSSAPVGGLQISNLPSTTAPLAEGSFGYSSSLGRLNRMDPSATSGAVDYGASVGNSTVRYGLTPVLTLEGQMQSAPSLTTRGMGTTYAAGDYGTFQAGATQSSFDAASAWRYRFGYSVDVADAVNLGYTNEQIGAGFGDLSTYSGGVAAAPQTRNTLTAGVPISGWGTLSGTYSGLHEGSALAEQRVGLSHSMFVAPKVKLAVGADRDIISGNYEWRANLSMPVDTFMRGTWLSW